uniref:Uncharacterized protein n=1 Tax=Leishmania guyanensis TaxID=5670 RepID=A0A1E1IWW0_LEIGU|nr:Hypothetical protein BN36_2333000 [Leishmania guyanensis]
MGFMVFCPSSYRRFRPVARYTHSISYPFLRLLPSLHLSTILPHCMPTMSKKCVAAAPLPSPSTHIHIHTST